MTILREGWLSQRRRVARLNRFVRGRKDKERRLVRAAGMRVRHLVTRFETLALVGATGAVWASRIRERSDAEPRRPVSELVAAILIVSRWRHIARRLGVRGRAS